MGLWQANWFFLSVFITEVLSLVKVHHFEYLYFLQIELKFIWQIAGLQPETLEFWLLNFFNSHLSISKMDN